MFAIKAARFFKAPLRNVRSVSNQEIQIPVPWGHIAGKWWGPQDKRPILALHGWQDNCGSFDLLIPKLPEHLGYLTLDLPGHGRSSWFPPGMFYDHTNLVVSLRYIRNYMGWDKMSFMGHSAGAILCYMYGLMHPGEVDFMMCFDGLQPLINTRGLSHVACTIDNFLKYDEQSRSNNEPQYTMEELKERLRKGSGNSIDLDKCGYILERNVRERAPGKYCFTRDPRVKCLQLLTWPADLLKQAARTLRFPLIYVLCDKHMLLSIALHYVYAIEALWETNEEFQWVLLDGTHHGHLNDPEQHAKVLTNFIMKHDKFDRSNGGILNEIKCN